MCIGGRDNREVLAAGVIMCMATGGTIIGATAARCRLGVSGGDMVGGGVIGP